MSLTKSARLVLVTLVLCFALAFAPTLARADPLAVAPKDELSAAPRKDGFAIEQVETALSAYQQRGFGFQSKEGPLPFGPGSQRLTVFQPQVLVQARQSARITHRFWLPVDIVTAASPNATDRDRKPPDMMSNASRQNQAATFDWTAAYDAPRSVSASTHNSVHVEENFRSWGTGLGTTMSFADDNAVLAANANQFFDWFSRYDALGHRLGRTTRSTTNGNIGISQIVSPTTIVHANYGISAQYGDMSNTWNSLPFETGIRVSENVPRHRTRHAVVGRFAQFLPWNGVVKGFYRFYADGWGLVAHAAEVQVLQRILPTLYLRGSYRFYHQTAVDFFTTLGTPNDAFLTADSNLGEFYSHTVGVKAVADVPLLGRGSHLDIGYERYWRTDGLVVNVALWQAGTKF